MQQALRLAAAALSILLSGVAGAADYRHKLPLPSTTVPDGWGVNIHFTDPQPREMEMIAKAGFKWVRMDFFWQEIEKEKGVYDFSADDRLMASLKKNGIRPIFILDYGNDLYEKGSPRSPKAVAAFAAFAAASVTHFKGQGVVWEMWNEPNIFFWKPSPNVNDYITLATAVGKSIRKAEPQEWYVGPATAGIDFAFLEACFKARLLDYWDDQLCELGAQILAWRAAAVKELARVAAERQPRLTGGGEHLAVRYRPGLVEAQDVGNLGDDGPLAALAQLRRSVDRVKAREIAAGISMMGPHRDDLALEVNEVDANAFGSRGQQRTATLALKLAELEYIREHTGNYPLLLLDDAGSELDERRRAAILQVASEAKQTFVTSAASEMSSLPPTSQRWSVVNGALHPFR